MVRDRDLWLPDCPPVQVMPYVVIIGVTLPFRVMLSHPAGIVLVPPGVAVPDMMVIEVSPPIRIISPITRGSMVAAQARMDARASSGLVG
jgi:hypothetical protein